MRSNKNMDNLKLLQFDAKSFHFPCKV
uniref:Uncharacterized protein n=1 Tax=Arundo donax TaxID=35708 RepID=A0A0A8ZNM2_ARUDO